MKVFLKPKEKKQHLKIKRGYFNEVKQFKGSMERANNQIREPLFYSSKGSYAYIRKSRRKQNPKKEADLFRGCSKEVFFKLFENGKDKPFEHLCFKWLQ